MGTYIAVNGKKLSHEVNTSMTGILSNAELLQYSKLSSEQTSNCIKDIYKSGKTLWEFINSLLQCANEQELALNRGIDISQKQQSKQNKLKVRRGHWLSVLVVEDEPIIQRVHRIMLENLGCRVEIAEDGFEAIKMLTGRHDYEIIFMDIGLPKMTGIQTVEKIRAQKNNKLIPIVGLTAYPIAEVKKPCKKAGFNNVVSKPITAEALKAILHAIAKQRINYQII